MPKARKDTVCDCCHFPITEGSEYHYQRIPPWEQEDGGSYWTFRAHLYCHHFLIEDYCEDGRWTLPDAEDFRYYTICGEQKFSEDQMQAIVNQPAVACRQCEKVTFPRLRGEDDSPYCSDHCFNNHLGLKCQYWCKVCEREKRKTA